MRESAKGLAQSGTLREFCEAFENAGADSPAFGAGNHRNPAPQAARIRSYWDSILKNSCALAAGRLTLRFPLPSNVLVEIGTHGPARLVAPNT
jgi:hypothetical protein